MIRYLTLALQALSWHPVGRRACRLGRCSTAAAVRRSRGPSGAGAPPCPAGARSLSSRWGSRYLCTGSGRTPRGAGTREERSQDARHNAAARPAQHPQGGRVRAATRLAHALGGMLDAVPGGDGDGMADKAYGAHADCKKIDGKGRRPAIPRRDGHVMKGLDARALAPRRRAGIVARASARHTAGAAWQSPSLSLKSGSEDSPAPRPLPCSGRTLPRCAPAATRRPKGRPGAPALRPCPRGRGGGGYARPCDSALPLRPRTARSLPGAARGAQGQAAHGAFARPAGAVRGACRVDAARTARFLLPRARRRPSQASSAW